MVADFKTEAHLTQALMWMLAAVDLNTRFQTVR